MSDNDSIPHSTIYAQVEPEHIADVNWIMEGYGHLALVSTIDSSAGLISFNSTPDTYFDTLNIIQNMPFRVEIVESFAQEW